MMNIIGCPIYPGIPFNVDLPDQTMVEMGWSFLFLAFSVFFAWAISSRMKASAFKCNVCVNVLISAVVSVLMQLVYGVNMTAFKGMILLFILLYASCSDITSRTVDDSVFLMILLLACVGYRPEKFLSMILGALIVFVPQVALNVIKPARAIGGADIKITTSIAFLLGVEKGIAALVMGLIIAIAYKVVKARSDKQNVTAPFPLIPFITAGSMIAYLI